MSVIWVPPGSTSPYQNGAGAVTKLTSLKVLLLHALIGVEASTVPLASRQLLAVGKTVKEADWLIPTTANTPARMVTILFMGFERTRAVAFCLGHATGQETCFASCLGVRRDKQKLTK